MKIVWLFCENIKIIMEKEYNLNNLFINDEVFVTDKQKSSLIKYYFQVIKNILRVTGNWSIVTLYLQTESLTRNLKNLTLRTIAKYFIDKGKGKAPARTSDDVFLKPSVKRPDF